MKATFAGILPVRRTIAQKVIGRGPENYMVEAALEVDELFSLKGDQRGGRLAALQGNLWITQQGDSEDFVLRPGERFTITRPGKVVVQAMREARVRYIPHLPGDPT
jgi:hypothetical protein